MFIDVDCWVGRAVVGWTLNTVDVCVCGSSSFIIFIFGIACMWFDIDIGLVYRVLYTFIFTFIVIGARCECQLVKLVYHVVYRWRLTGSREVSLSFSQSQLTWTKHSPHIYKHNYIPLQLPYSKLPHTLTPALSISMSFFKQRKPMYTLSVDVCETLHA